MHNKLLFMNALFPNIMFSLRLVECFINQLKLITHYSDEYELSPL